MLHCVNAGRRARCLIAATPGGFSATLVAPGGGRLDCAPPGGQGHDAFADAEAQDLKRGEVKVGIERLRNDDLLGGRGGRRSL